MLLVLSTCSQAPPRGLLKSICVMPEPLTRPRPLKMAVEPPVVETVMFFVPSWPDLAWIARGAVVSDGATLHLPAGSSRLTTQFSELELSAQLEVSEFTSWKRTEALRRTASAR